MSVKVEYVLIAVLIYLIYFLLDQLAFYKFIKNYNEKATYKFTLYIGIITLSRGIVSPAYNLFFIMRIVFRISAVPKPNRHLQHSISTFHGKGNFWSFIVLIAAR